MKWLATFMCAAILTPWSSATGDNEDGNVGVSGSDTPLSPTVQVEGSVTTEGGLNDVPGPTIEMTDGEPSPVEYSWLLACSENRPGAAMLDCSSAHTCPDEVESRWILWARELPTGEWFEYASECYKTKPPIPDRPPRPSVTPDMVEEAVRRLGLPALPLQVQPADATLVNFDTIFYTEPQPFDHTVTLVGFDVRVVAEPVSYGWAFGDGSAVTTGIPGAPYPAKDVVHRYDDAHVTVEPSVDVTYEIRYAVDGGAFQQLDTTLTAQGPPTGLRIREATALLAGTD